jgi:hypothetical protein
LTTNKVKWGAVGENNMQKKEEGIADRGVVGCGLFVYGCLGLGLGKKQKNTT